MNPLRLLPALALLLALAALSPLPLDAQQTDVIRGRVISADSLPLENVQVTVTSISGNVSRSARTDRSGRFTITFPGGEGDYIVSFAAIGFTPRRYELRRVADEDILIADARLVPVTRLEAVTVSGQRPRVDRNDPVPEVSGTEQGLDAYAAGLPAADLGDLAAMAATLPGVQLVPGEGGDPSGFSVFGLGADQNTVTLNGMMFGGSNLPRDAAVATSLATSPYDVSRGGFSGAQFSMRSRPGSNFRIRGMSLNVDAPQMQWTDRTAQALGQEFTNLSLGGIVSGPIRFDRSFYNFAYQFGRRTNDYFTLLDGNPIALQAAGVATDSAARMRALLGAAGVPLAGGRLDTRVTEQGSIFGSFDFNSPSSSAGHAFNVTVNGSWNRQDPVGGGPTDLPSLSGERRNWRGGVQARHSGYLAPIFGALSETTVGVSASENVSTPSLDLPAGRVRVSSEFEDGSSAVQMLGFGGSQQLRGSQRGSNVAFNNSLSWFSTNSAHRLRLTSELRHETVGMRQDANLLGTFTYNALADLEQHQPSMFTRQLTPRRSEVGQLTGAVSLGDSWRRTQNLQLQYGVRVDANRFTSRPEVNPLVEETFGVANDRVPNDVYVSPRIGFSWTYGSAPQVSGFAGAARIPRAVVRGGIGIFQSTPQPGLLGSSTQQTGLAWAVQQLGCTGAATPIPDWSGYLSDPLSIPDRCADGTLGSVFADAAPNVSLFASDYQSPRSIRSTLQWSGPALDNRFALQLELAWSRNRNQPGSIDLNLDPTARFTLTDEGDRPVFVQPTSIVPATGAVAARDSRVSPLFSRVSELRSDLASESRQFRVGLAPTRFSTGLTWSLAYVHSTVREQTWGFASTAGNPFDREWSRSSFDARHQIVYSVGYNFFDFVRVNWFGSFRSGTPFTPMIAGDINGDGYANDRAFVFDPDEAGDPALAEGMRSILENGSSAARRCLRDQLGRIASRNSCEGPWTSTATMSFSFNPLKVRLPQRASLSFQLSNPIGAADLLLHGSDNLRGWGQTPMPDQSLLYVRGFDPGTQRYTYEVNQRFGATNPVYSTFRTPVTLTALMRIDLGTPREHQLLTQQLDRGRRTAGSRMPEALLRAMYGTGGLANPMAAILRQQDSLGLTSMQADSVAALNRAYLIRSDSIWAPLAVDFASLPEDYPHGPVRDRYRQARRATVDMLIALAPHVTGLLTPEQLRKLPPIITSHLEPRYLASVRSGTNSFVGGGLASAPQGASPVMSGGGPGAVTIVRQQQ